MALTRLALLVLLAAACACEAKGIFQAQGRITQVERSGDAITFRFSGWISFGYASAPDSDPKRRWRNLGWDKVDVPVTLAEWTLANQPERRDEHADVAGIHGGLVELAARGHPIAFSIDNPGLHFTNKGQLARVTGTHVYAHDMREPARGAALKRSP